MLLLVMDICCRENDKFMTFAIRNGRIMLVAYMVIVMIICCTRPCSAEENATIFDYEFDESMIDQTITSDSTDSGFRSYVIKPMIKYKYLTSPYQSVPGTYQTSNDQYYTGTTPYNSVSIYSSYLTNGAYQYHAPGCIPSYGKVPKVESDDIDRAFSYANSVLYSRFPEYANISNYNGTSHKELEGYTMELASEYFAKYKCFSKYQLAVYLPRIPVNDHYLNKQGDASCLPFYSEKYKCYPAQTSKYRTIDGSCNNLISPYWGRSFTCHIRLLPSDYSDGIKEFRMSKSGGPLPNPRVISNYITLSRDLKSYYTAMVLVWGQFLTHDISNTEGHLANPSHKIDCCKSPDSRCAIIPVYTEDDYLLSNFKTKCINFVRSMPCPLCKMGPREQLNSQTTFIDGSQIYGATLEEATKLRSFTKGQLLAYRDSFGNLLLPTDPEIPCAPRTQGMDCFKAGDNRVNQHPLLLVMHTLLMRNHNHHAFKLSYVNPRWNDEKLFQEARRINIAEMQHITANEYLPVILGPMLMDYYRLNPLKTGYTTYEPYTDPSTWNEFTTAACRFGHSQIKDYYQMKSADNYNVSIFALRDRFLDPEPVYGGKIDDLIRGSISEVSDTVDPYFTHTTKNFIMKTNKKKHGIDLVAVNILRGRDHGIPGYIHYLKACFNYEAKSWYDLERFIPREVLAKMKNIYRFIEDIDLYVAGMAERHFIDASIGPTFGCLVGMQFYHLKYGDRYFYEHGGYNGSFNLAQLNNIRQSSLARLLCRTSKTIYKIQQRPLYLPSKMNPLVDCRTIPEINYLLWKE